MLEVKVIKKCVGQRFQLVWRQKKENINKFYFFKDER
jgi:hypothetical protein